MEAVLYEPIVLLLLLASNDLTHNAAADPACASFHSLRTRSLSSLSRCECHARGPRREIKLSVQSI